VKLETVRIPAEGATLTGLHYVPEGDRIKSTAILYTHGFTSGKYSLDTLAGYLGGRGYHGLTFDLIGHKLGGSGGEMRYTLQAAENLRDALLWARIHLEAERFVLVGHSMGAAAGVQVAAWEQRRPGSPPLTGIVSLCMGLEPALGFETQIGRAMLAQRRDYVAGAPALELLQGLSGLLLSAPQIGDLPALFIAARQDVLVPVARVEALAALAGGNASVVALDAAHLDAPDRSRATIIQWLEARGF
jgi:pimeloyl-ACP methyl ester carboxylesterase